MTLRAEAALLRVCPTTLRRWAKGGKPRSRVNRKHWYTYTLSGPHALRDLLAFEDSLERTIRFGSRTHLPALCSAPAGKMEGIYYGPERR